MRIDCKVLVTRKCRGSIVCKTVLYWARGEEGVLGAAARQMAYAGYTLAQNARKRNEYFSPWMENVCGIRAHFARH